ncbi:4750_t:CDS:2 [Scutellospora calospora]|uniref:4750_t:CDS:1 n=1 Tax=Scutellospora calospora TaxID=85575 RepID=A0ACA9JVV2_9GLOM|nr:4750_t:CDS:2 [Scutellospora calospora]
MNIICEVVSSVRSKDKININKFLMNKNKKNNQHYLKDALDHNHSAYASRLEVVKTIARIKEQAQQTHDKPAQIMQTVIANSSQYVYLYLLLTNALRQTIQRIRHLDLFTKPGSLESLIIPEYLR